MFARSPHAPGWRNTARATAFAATAIGISLAVASPAAAVNTAHPSVVSADPANWTPHMADGTVHDFTQAGDRVYAGGTFTSVRNAGTSAQLNRRYLVAINTTSRTVDTGFNATLDGPVQALVRSADGQSIYVGGSFNNVNGTRASRVVRLNAATGAIWPGWTSVAISAVVNDLKLLGDRLIVGGSFQQVGGLAQPGLVALNAATGAVDPFLNNITLSGPRTATNGSTAPLKVESLDVNPAGTRLVIIGNFSRVNGQSRPQVAMIDLTTSPASLHSWATERFAVHCSSRVPSYVTDVDISPDGSYMVIVTRGAAGGISRLCDSASRWEVNTTGGAKQPTWVNYTGGDTLLSVAITGAAVYVGGHQRWLDNPYGVDSAGPGAVSREGIGAIHPVTGRALSWNPGKTRGVGTQSIFSTSAGLWIGSDGNLVAGEQHHKIAFFPL